MRRMVNPGNRRMFALPHQDTWLVVFAKYLAFLDESSKSVHSLLFHLSEKDSGICSLRGRSVQMDARNVILEGNYRVLAPDAK